MANSNNPTECPVSATLGYIGGRWKTLIIYVLLAGDRRFGEIAVRIPAVSRKILTEQLRELEADGLLTRTAYRETPPRVEYALTERGRSLSSVLAEMANWGRTNVLINQSTVQPVGATVA